MQGLGRIYCENGLIFDGNFEKGHLNGIGFLYNSETNIFYEGLFYENECNKLFKKTKGFQLDSIIKHRYNQHKLASQFKNQLLFMEIVQIIQGQISLTQQLNKNYKTSHVYGSIEDQYSIIQNDNNPLYNYIQKNKEFMEIKRNNLFYYPNQVMSRQLFNTSQQSFHHIHPTQHSYEEYEFSLHEFQRQLERPTYKETILTDNYQMNDIQKQNSLTNSFNNSYTNSNLYSGQKNSISPQRHKNLNSVLSTNQVNTRISSPQVKTFDSFISYHTENDTPINRTPQQRRHFTHNIDRKLSFSNTQGSIIQSNSQTTVQNPYFQIIPPQSQENLEIQRISMSKQTLTQNSFTEKDQSIRAHSPYNNKTTKKQGNWLYEQIRGRSYTPNISNRQNNNYNNQTVIERSTSKNQYKIENNRSNTPTLPNSQQKIQYISLQNQYKRQGMDYQIQNTYSTSQKRICDQQNSENELPKSRIFNRPKSSLSINVIQLQKQQQDQRIPHNSFHSKNISPNQSFTTLKVQRPKQHSPSLQQYKLDMNNRNKNQSFNSKVFQNNNKNDNSFKRSQSPIQYRRQNKQSPILHNKECKKQNENIKQVHLRLPSTFFN